MRGSWLAAALVVLSSALPAAAENVGMTGRLEGVVLPGPELVAAPRGDRPIVLRITATYPHGSDTRYDLEFYGLEGGTFDLRDYLQRADGAAFERDDLPPLGVVIVDVLPPGLVRPHPLSQGDVPEMGGTPPFLPKERATHPLRPWPRDSHLGAARRAARGL